MVYFTDIKKSQHYIENHEAQVSWYEVICIIQEASKNFKKKGDKLEIETDEYYILCELNYNILSVINAKRK